MSISTSNKQKTELEQTQVQRLLKCDQDGCNKSFPRRHQLKKHQEAHLKGTQRPVNLYRCDEAECEAKFYLPERLRKHQLVDHNGERPFQCDFEGCDKRYKSDHHLKRHKATNHSNKACTSEEVMCKGCGNTYCNKYVLKQHMAVAHVEHDDAVMPKSTKKKSEFEKKHICDEPGCNAAFTRPYRLKNHKLTVHGNDKPFECEYPGCEKKYTNESHLARHKTTIHYPNEINTEKAVICGEEGCGLIFSSKYYLKRHITRVHTLLPFSCSDCGEKFKRKSRLQVHKVEVHNKEASFKCNSCSKMFVNLHLYNKHLKTHKTYQCDCEKTFDKWTKLLEHRRSECSVKPKEYKCVICNRTFGLKAKLTQHSLYVHVSDSQLDLIKCPYLNCNRSYKYKSNLKGHIRTYHENIFDHVKCTEKNCDKVYKSNRNLKQHLRAHHGLPAKVRKPRRPRKDKGIPKTSMASLISGVEVTAEENYRNTMENIDENLNASEIVVHRLDKNGCGRKFKNVMYKTEDQKSCERIINNTKIKEEQAEGRSTNINSLDDNQKTTSDVVESSPMSNIVTSTPEEFSENLHEVVSMDIDIECSKPPTALDLNKLKEPTRGLNDNVKNQNNSDSINAINIEDCGKNIEEMNKGHSKTSDTVAIACNSNDMVVDMVVDPKFSQNSVLIEIPSNETIRELDNGEINNTKGGTRYTTDDTPNDNLLSVNMVPVLLNSSPNSSTNGVVLFDFSDFDTTKLSNTITIKNKANDEEQTAAKNLHDCNNEYKIK